MMSRDTLRTPIKLSYLILFPYAVSDLVSTYLYYDIISDISCHHVCINAQYNIVSYDTIEQLSCNILPPPSFYSRRQPQLVPIAVIWLSCHRQRRRRRMRCWRYLRSSYRGKWGLVLDYGALSQSCKSTGQLSRCCMMYLPVCIFRSTSLEIQQP